MLAYSNGSQFHFTAELQSIWLVSGGGGGVGPPAPTHPTLTVSCEEFCILAFLPHSELWRVLHSCFPSSQLAVKSSTFLLALCLLWAGVVKHYTAVPADWDPSSSACCLLCWKIKWGKCLHGWGMKLCGCSSCVWGLLKLFVEYCRDSDFASVSVEWWSLIQMWSASFAQQCRVLLSVIVTSFKFCFWVCFGDVMVSDDTGGLISMAWNSFFRGPILYANVIDILG